MKYERIEQLRHQYPTAVLCRVIDVSESGYHAWRKRPPSARQQESVRLETEIRATHQRTKETYGPKRLQSELADHGVVTGIDRIKRIRRKFGLRCKQKRKFKATTDSRHSLPLAPNCLNPRFDIKAPNRVWVTDITYVATDEGWLYLAGVKDMFSGELVGYAMSKRMTTPRVMQALFWAVAAKRPENGLLHHSDRGSQYCAHAYQKLLRQFGMQASMSRKGNCWDNAPMESFWVALKTELVHHRRFSTREQAQREITEYIEIFYNRIRKQARLAIFLLPLSTENTMQKK